MTTGSLADVKSAAGGHLGTVTSCTTERESVSRSPVIYHPASPEWDKIRAPSREGDGCPYRCAHSPTSLGTFVD